MFPNYTFILDTNPERFTNRLIPLAWRVLPTSFPAMAGTWFIYDVRSSRELDGSQHVIASGSLQYSRMDEEGAETQRMTVGINGRGSPLVEFVICPLTDSRIEVNARCGHKLLVGSFLRLLEAINERWPSPSLMKLLEPEADSDANNQERQVAARKYGTHGGTQDRVQEARRLIDDEREFKTRACKRVGIDIRTYDRYVMDLTCPEEGDEE